MGCNAATSGLMTLLIGICVELLGEREPGIACFMGMLSAAPAPPFYVLLAQQHSEGITGFGLLIVSSGLAASLGAPIWGRMGDQYSRRMMVIAAAAAGIPGLLTWLLDNMGTPVMNSPLTYAVLFFLIAVFHGGVRLCIGSINRLFWWLAACSRPGFRRETPRWFISDGRPPAPWRVLRTSPVGRRCPRHCAGS